MTTKVTKSISAAQRKKDPHAGPHGSFPEDAAHLKAAWDLAGHAANPDAVREKVLAYAKAHGLEDHLPADAKAHLKNKETVKKAKAEDLQGVMQNAFSSGDDYTRHSLVRYAADNDLVHHLPDAAHPMLHEMGVPHKHAEMENDEEDKGAGHVHKLTKATPKVGFFTLEKAWGDETEDTFYEGWLSTPTKDLEKDITEPEAFIPAIDSYFARRAPVSVQHGMDFLPAGHLQHAAIMRDGKVLKAATHPTDSAEFEYQPTSGSGVWVRGRLTESPAKDSVRKGNCGGMSFVAMATEYNELPGGGRRITKITPLQETTVAPYPVNPDAAIAVAKAFGLEPEAETSQKETNDMSQIDELLAKALEARKATEAEQKTAEGVTEETLGALFLEFEEKMIAAANKTVEAAMQKALPVRGEGAGRKGGVAAEAGTDRDADPVKYIMKKAISGQELDEVDQKILAVATWKSLGDGLADGGDDDMDGQLAAFFAA